MSTKTRANKRGEERFFEFTRILTKDFEEFLRREDIFLVNGLESKGIPKLPNNEMARRAYDRYIKMVEVLVKRDVFDSEEKSLKVMLQQLEDEKDNTGLKNELISGWKVVDPENKIYDENPEKAVDTAQRILATRIEKIKKRKEVYNPDPYDDMDR